MATSITAAPRCQLGGLFSSCKGAAQASCQYCGRDFCDDHKHYAEGYEAVCTHKKCRRKHDDLQEHLVYRDRAAELNRYGQCGVEKCGPARLYQCTQCTQAFCPSHLSERLYPAIPASGRPERMATVCGRCWARRKIWR